MISSSWSRKPVPKSPEKILKGPGRHSGLIYSVTKSIFDQLQSFGPNYRFSVIFVTLRKTGKNVKNYLPRGENSVTKLMVCFRVISGVDPFGVGKNVALSIQITREAACMERGQAERGEI